MNATLDGLTFLGDGSLGTYTLEEITGWWGGVEMRHASIPRPNADGDFDAPVFQSGRLLTLVGHVHASTDAAFETAMQALEDLLADGSKEALTVEQASATYAIEVRRHGLPDFAVLVYGRAARFQLHLWAPDPEKELVP